MKRNFALSIILYCTLSPILMAQPGKPQPGGQNSPAPIGFIETMLGIGAIYGLKKKIAERKEK